MLFGVSEPAASSASCTTGISRDWGFTYNIRTSAVSCCLFGVGCFFLQKPHTRCRDKDISIYRIVGLKRLAAPIWFKSSHPTYVRTVHGVSALPTAPQIVPSQVLAAE